MIRTCAGCGRGPLIPRDRWHKGEPGVPHQARELCVACYHKLLPPRNKPPAPDPRVARRQALLEDYEFLTGCGVSRADAAPRLGLTLAALENMLAREGRRTRDGT